MVAEASTPDTLLDALRYFTPEVAASYIRSIKWPEGPVCPKCGSVRVSAPMSRGRFQCRERECRRQFTLIANTILAGTHLRFDQWIVAVWMIANCRNGVSSCEIARAVGCKQQSAWHLLHRVRAILAQEHRDLLVGTVEADTTLVGGLLKHMHRRRRAKFANAMGNTSRLSGKTIVHVLRERHSGNVRASVLAGEKTEDIRPLIEGNVRPGARLHTDDAHAYKRFGTAYVHESVNHYREEYVRGDVHVQGCESFFNCLRRALRGTYVRASPEHLEAYVQEAVYRFNVRKDGEWERFDRAMRAIVGKRLTYSDLTGGAVR